MKTWGLNSCVMLLLYHYLEWYTSAHGKVNYRKPRAGAVETAEEEGGAHAQTHLGHQLPRHRGRALSQGLWSDRVSSSEAPPMGWWGSCCQRCGACLFPVTLSGASS